MKKQIQAIKPTIKKVGPSQKSFERTGPYAKKPVEMISYSIKMVIPTGAYANIQPEIVVCGGSIQEAHDFVAPHMNKLWKEYFMVNERRQEVIKPPTPAPIPTGSTGTTPAVSTPNKPMSAQEIAKEVGGTVMGERLPKATSPSVPSPESSVALIKATQAIQSCVSLEALELIQNQVVKSVKLTHEDKESLMPLLEKKAIDLTFPEDEKRGN